MGMNRRKWREQREIERDSDFEHEDTCIGDRRSPDLGDRDARTEWLGCEERLGPARWAWGDFYCANPGLRLARTARIGSTPGWFRCVPSGLTEWRHAMRRGLSQPALLFVCFVVPVLGETAGEAA